MIGKSIGHFEVTAKVGEGGMGEVYRATDTKLRRDVALKVLPDAFATDEQRMGRFEREAQLLASLSHPNIASIFGIEETEGSKALVMELVEGEDLSDRMQRGSLSTEEIARIAVQIACALESAHDSGVIHRDLKPANVKLTPDGTVKVLDFGLAKAMEPDQAQSSADLTQSPTMSLAATQAGLILGTAGYMSPEQASGTPVDKRADIWSFGVVVFEMCSGQALFRGETAAHTMADVLRADIDWSLLPADLPRPLRRLLERCLDRRAAHRLRDIGEARVALEDFIADPEAGAVEVAAAAVTEVQAAPSRLPWVVAGALALALVGSVVALWMSSGGPRPHIGQVQRQSFRRQYLHLPRRQRGAVSRRHPDGVERRHGRRRCAVRARSRSARAARATPGPRALPQPVLLS